MTGAANWREITLGTLEAESHGVIQTGPFGSQLHAHDYSADGTPVVMPTNIRDLRISTDGIARVSDEHVERLARHRLRAGDIVYSRRGDVEKCALVTDKQADWLCGTGCLLVRVQGPTVDARCLAYLLSLPSTRAWISQHAVGATMPNLNTGILREVPVVLPPIDEQRSIAATLGALDDKIESNRRAIELAESLGDALFEDAATETARLSDLATLIMGTSPPGTSYNEDGAGVSFYQGVRDFGRRYPSQRVRTTAPVRMAEPNDTLVSVRAPVGKLNRAPEACCIGRGVATVRSQWPSAIYYALRAANSVWEPFQQEGTVFGAINRADLAGARLLWPPSGLLSNLECRVSALDGRIESLTLETARLTALRDTLLPELLSGRIQVPAARETVAEALG